MIEKSRAFRAGFLMFALAGFCLGLPSAHAVPIDCAGIPGAATESGSDSISPEIDLTCASITIDGDNAIFVAAFNPVGFAVDTARVSFTLDTDQNAATGFPGIDSINSDAALMGTEYFVFLRAQSFQGTTSVLQFDAGAFPEIGTPAVVEAFDNGFRAILPFALFGGGSGDWFFKATSQFQVADNQSGGIRDYISNIGLAPIATNVIDVPPVPLPPAVALMLSGLLLLGRFVRRRRAA